MTKIKLCGLSRLCDIEAANELKPDYIGFVFAKNSRRAVSPEKAAELKAALSEGIRTIGVFADEPAETVAGLLRSGVIDAAQLHGREDEAFIRRLRALTDKPIIRAFRIQTAWDAAHAGRCSADLLLLDSGAGTGRLFDWTLIRDIHRPYFLAGGLDAGNVGAAIRQLRPYAVDVSSGIETFGAKDKTKMAAFVAAVKKEDQI